VWGLQLCGLLISEVIPGKPLGVRTAFAAHSSALAIPLLRCGTTFRAGTNLCAVAAGRAKFAVQQVDYCARHGGGQDSATFRIACRRRAWGGWCGPGVARLCRGQRDLRAA